MTEAEKNIDGLKRMRIALANVSIDGERVLLFLTAGIEALEKEIPKAFDHQNHKNKETYIDIHSCQCPTCNFEWRTLWTKQPRCPECGQRLDWEEEVESSFLHRE